MPRSCAPDPADRSDCPLACALDLLGDRWSLLVLRDVLFFGKAQFQEFLTSPEGISSNTLAQRLKRLEQYGLLTKEPYQERPVRHRYLPTAAGRELMPLLVEAVRWGARHVPGAAQLSEEQLAHLDGLIQPPGD